jgi:hypothetical protein
MGDIIIQMTIIHLLQSQAWLETMVGFKKPTQEFKMHSNRALTSIKHLLTFLKVKSGDEEYNISAEISDSILELARMNNEQRELIYDYIQKVKNLPKYKPENLNQGVIKT